MYLDSRPDAAILAKKESKLKGFFKTWAMGYKGTKAEEERREKSSFWLAVGILPLLITATSTLGFVFGIQAGRPGWYSGLQAPGFVIMAAISGVGMIIIISAFIRNKFNLQDEIGEKIFRWLGNTLLILCMGYLYFIAVEWLTGSYAGSHHEEYLVNTLMTGKYAPFYWGTILCLGLPVFLLFVQYLKGQSSISLAVFCGVLVNIAAITRRFIIVVPSQTHGSLLPYSNGSYSPTWVEYSIIIGLVALGILIFIGFTKIFPIMQVKHQVVEGK